MFPGDSASGRPRDPKLPDREVTVDACYWYDGVLELPRSAVNTPASMKPPPGQWRRKRGPLLAPVGLMYENTESEPVADAGNC